MPTVQMLRIQNFLEIYSLLQGNTQLLQLSGRSNHRTHRQYLSKANEDASFEALDDKLRNEANKYIDSLAGFLPPDSYFAAEELVAWGDGLQITAKDLLESVVEVESLR